MTRFHPSGRAQSWSFNPYWVRLELEESESSANRLSLRSHGRVLRFGSFLSDDEKRGFAHALAHRALRCARLPRVAGDCPTRRVHRNAICSQIVTALERARSAGGHTFDEVKMWRVIAIISVIGCLTPVRPPPRHMSSPGSAESGFQVDEGVPLPAGPQGRARRVSRAQPARKLQGPRVPRGFMSGSWPACSAPIAAPPGR